MRSAIGNAMLLSVVIIIVSAVILIFINILSYSKAYRVKNRIIEIIEKYGKYEDENAKKEIAVYLKEVGYTQGKCLREDDPDENWYFSRQGTMGYKFCVAGVYNDYENQFSRTNTKRYYIVTTYVEFNFPIINSWLTVPVTGETKVLGKDYDVYE